MTLFLIHGWSCNETFWLPQREEFRKSYRAISIDLPGHGKSEEFPQYSMELFARAVEAVRVKEQAVQIVLVGHSMGAVVAREYAKKHSSKVRAFVFIDGSIFRLPPEEAGRERWRQMMEGLAARFSPALEKVVRERNISEFLSNMYAPETPREFQLMVLNQVLRTKAETAEGAFRAMADLRLWDDAALRQPALFLRAGRQEPPGESEYLQELFPGLSYKYLAGVSHFLHLEKPELVNKEVLSFLGRNGL